MGQGNFPPFVKKSSLGDAKADIDEIKKPKNRECELCSFHDTSENDSGRLKRRTKECVSVHYHA